MTKSEWYKYISDLLRELAKEQKASVKACEARMRLPQGSSRARVTTANARWSSAAEARDRTLKRLDELGVVIPRKAPEDLG